MNTLMIARKVLGGGRSVSKFVRSYSDEGGYKYEKSINAVTLLGRVGGEPQKRGSELHPLVTFSLATHTNYKTESGFNQKTDWHRICVFKPNLGENVFNYMKKGQRVYVSGKIMYGEVKDESGGVRSTTSILADEVIFFQQL